MRLVLGMMLLLVMPGALMAAPEPPPPVDYPGTQYIDRTGCVFVQEGTAWLPRKDSQGEPICGFPPSQPVAADVLPSPEEMLTGILADGLRPGDLASDPAPQALAEVPADPAQAALDTQLTKQVELDARMRSALSGQTPDGLCARLGYRLSGSATPLIGADVTQGLCPGMTPDAPAPVIAAAAAQHGTTPAKDSTKTPPVVKAVADKTAAPVRRAAPDRPRVVADRRTKAPAQQKAATVEMIPASARYVQIGAFQDEGNANAAVRRLLALGYPAAQRREQVKGTLQRVILAGPFSNRQDIVAALTRLRANGYPHAAAR